MALGLLAALTGTGSAWAQAPSVPLGHQYIYEFKLGLLAHDVPDIWSGFNRERGANLNGEIILVPSLAFLGGHFRPAVGGSVNVSSGGSARGTSIAYADIRWMYEAANGWFLGLGIGAAIHNGRLELVEPDRKVLGSRVLFHFPLEIGYRFDAQNSLSIYFDHVSNANTRPANEGLDSLGVRYGYRF
jgi:lipid A 3-O-deacylase